LRGGGRRGLRGPSSMKSTKLTLLIASFEISKPSRLLAGLRPPRSPLFCRRMSTIGYKASHDLVITRNRSVLGRSSIGQIEHDLVYVTPSPPLWRIVALDDRMAGSVEMLSCVSVRRTVTATDVSTCSADAQVNPHRP